MAHLPVVMTIKLKLKVLPTKISRIVELLKDNELATFSNQVCSRHHELFVKSRCKLKKKRK